MEPKSWCAAPGQAIRHHHDAIPVGGETTNKSTGRDWKNAGSTDQVAKARV